MDAPNEINYSSNIYVSDCSLRIGNGWLYTLIEEGEENIIMGDVCDALYFYNLPRTTNQFRQFLWGNRLCGGVLCRLSDVIIIILKCMFDQHLQGVLLLR